MMRLTSKILILFVLLSFLDAHFVNAKIDFNKEKQKKIFKTYGVEVIYYYNSQLPYPEFWLKPPILGKGENPKDKDIARALDAISDFLKSLPKGMIKNNLKKIYLIKNMQFYGKAYGGTWLNQSIYLTCNSKSLGYNRKYWFGALHHEFSSILMHAHDFPNKDWTHLNPKDFKYSGTGVEMLGQKNLRKGHAYYFRKGFLTKYSMSSLENDFNRFVEWTFLEHKDLKKALQYPLIKKKFELMRRFYQKVDNKIKFPNLNST